MTEELVVGIHQPNFMPWMGFFNKICLADVFVLIDEVQYVKGSVCKRTKLKNNMGEAVWLTVPVNLENGSASTFNEVKMADSKWQRKAINLIKASYLKTPFFQSYFPEVEELLLRDYQSLAKLNIAFINFFCTQFAIDTPIRIQSELGIEFGKKNYLNLGITKHFGGNVYLSGAGARKYNDPNLFLEEGVELRYQDFKAPRYSQANGEFIEGLSILDLLFNEGEKGRQRIL
jgi:hypothetical protein